MFKKKFPFYPQYDSMDCGAACLAMIAKFYGITLSRSKISDMCDITRNGVSLLEIKRAAKTIGLDAIGVSVSLDALKSNNPTPCIIHWNQRHFVVLYRMSKSWRAKGQYSFYISDPVFGRVKFSEKDFKKHWLHSNVNNDGNGLLMYFNPHVDYTKEPAVKDNNQWKVLGRHFLRYKKNFLQLGIILIIGLIIQLIFPFLTQLIVDIGIGDKDLSFIYIILIAQAILIISRSIAYFIRSWLLLHISVRINLLFISEFFGKLVKLPMIFFESKKIGDIMQRITDHEQVEEFVTNKSIETTLSIFSLLAFSIVLFYYNITIFIVYVIGSFFYAIWVMTLLNKRKTLNYRFYNKKSQNQSTTYELITSMQEIKLQGCANRKQSEWESLQVELLDLHTDNLKLDQYSEAGNVLINESKNMLVTIIAAISVISGDITLGTMLAIQYIIGQLSLPVEQLAKFIFSIQDVNISMDRINEIYNRPNEVLSKQIIPESIPCGDIIIDKLHFKYTETSRTFALQDVSVKILRGKTTAIVGFSGSGKTTLIKLLLHYYTPSKGTIKMGNTDFYSLDPEWWRSQCGVVMQDGYIFSDTIANNIAASDSDVDMDRVIYASKIANIYDRIMSLPLKFKTEIGANGQGLSQGERQRLLIARSVYKDAPYLFFDEATNSLDTINERMIVEQLNHYYHGRTVVIIAHRLSTIKNADSIIVLDKGRVVETGSHDSLIALKKHYYNLIKNQLALDN